MHWEQCCTQIIARAQFTHEGVVCSCVYKHIAMVIVVLFCFFGALVIYSTHKHQELVNCISFSWRGCKGLVPSFLVCRGQWPHAEYPPPDVLWCVGAGDYRAPSTWLLLCGGQGSQSTLPGVWLATTDYPPRDSSGDNDLHKHYSETFI